MKMVSKETEKKVAKGYTSGTLSITFLLCVVFGLIGAVVAGWAGLAVGIVIVLMASLISSIGIIPFAGIPLYIWLYNVFMDWLYTVVPQLGSFLAPDALPRVVLFWIFGIMAGIACVVFSALAVIVIIGGLAAVLSWTSGN